MRRGWRRRERVSSALDGARDWPDGVGGGGEGRVLSSASWWHSASAPVVEEEAMRRMKLDVGCWLLFLLNLIDE